MNSDGYDFGWLTQPIVPDDFFGDYWERRPLHLKRHDREYYGGVLCHQDLERLISSADLRYPAIKLIPKGQMASYRPETYTTNWKHGNDVFAGVPDIDKVFEQYRAGATVVLPGLERLWPPLTELCMALEAGFNHAARANVYITTENSQGFAPHYDTHEVFVLQIAGKKRWRVYDAPVSLPLVNQPFSGQPFARDYAPPAPLLEADLDQGDLLYIPRGFVHEASTSGSFSAHVTIGITVYTWVDLAAEVFMSSMDVSRFRGALPPGFASSENLRQVLHEGLTGLVEELQKNCNYDKLIDNFTNRVQSKRLRAKGVFQCDTSSS